MTVLDKTFTDTSFQLGPNDGRSSILDLQNETLHGMPVQVTIAEEVIDPCGRVTPEVTVLARTFGDSRMNLAAMYNSFVGETIHYPTLTQSQVVALIREQSEFFFGQDWEPAVTIFTIPGDYRYVVCCNQHNGSARIGVHRFERNYVLRANDIVTMVYR